MRWSCDTLQPEEAERDTRVGTAMSLSERGSRLEGEPDAPRGLPLGLLSRSPSASSRVASQTRFDEPHVAPLRRDEQV